MAGSDKGEKTEQPTGRKIRKAREEGQVPRTKELPSTLAIGLLLIFAQVGGSQWVANLVALFRNSLSDLDRGELTNSNLMIIMSETMMYTGTLLVAPLGIMVSGVILGSVLQGPPPFTLKPMEPKFDKINPVEGFKKIFAVKNLMEVAKTLFKLVAFSIVAYTTARDSMMGETGTPADAGETLWAIGTIARNMLISVTALAMFIALVDLFFQRWSHTRQLRMTKKEVKDEHKEQEGDPQIKAKIRQKQLAMARQRMMADVEKATTVITNPTHFAVALRFVPGDMAVPKVLAKGRARIALKIRSIAEEHKIPIVENPPLARALYKAVPIGGEVPEALYRAVAEVLAMVFRKKGPRRFPTPGHEGATS